MATPEAYHKLHHSLNVIHSRPQAMMFCNRGGTWITFWISDFFYVSFAHSTALASGIFKAEIYVPDLVIGYQILE